jgi:hypothetical protein
MTQVEMIQQELSKLHALAERNARILSNGIVDRIDKIEVSVEKLYDLMIEALKPKPAPSPYKKFLFKWGGTFVILLMFIGVLWVAYLLLPKEVANGIFNAVIEKATGQQ